MLARSAERQVGKIVGLDVVTEDLSSASLQDRLLQLLVSLGVLLREACGDNVDAVATQKLRRWHCDP